MNTGLVITGMDYTTQADFSSPSLFSYGKKLNGNRLLPGAMAQTRPKIQNTTACFALWLTVMESVCDLYSAEIFLFSQSCL